ncbi:MAG: CBS domain-containing protein [Acidimicrobiia bacterium]
MTQAVVTDSGDDNLAEAAARMREHQTGSLIVMQGNKIAGIFTERDLLKAIARGLDPKATEVRDVMTKEVVTVSPDTKVRDAASIMASKWIRHLPVVEGDKIAGMISQRDLAGLLAQAIDEPETLQEIRSRDLIRERRLQRIEIGDLD